MCGIIGSNQTDFHHQEVLNALYHRGPDNQDYTIKENNFLAHTRLSIIDLDDEANQPMSFDGLTLIFNGEIYNYKALIEIHKLSCRTASDSEVILRLYQKYGTDFLDYLEGMFAFCIYDANLKQYFCARDRFGKKPFYYYYESGRFYFASEIKAIIKMLQKTPPLNEEALWQYLAFQSPQGSNTFYQGIKKLPAGHNLLLEQNTLHLNQYYSLDAINIIHTDPKKIFQEIDTLLHKSVEKRLVSDVEVATLLSGGLDSSLITALYTKQSRKKVHTFSIGYDEYTHYCELSEAQHAADFLKTDHHEYRINKTDYLNTFDNVLDHLDEPMADSACIPTYLLAEKIHHNGFKVCLSGEGSDESFLGYDNYFKMLNYYNAPPSEVTPFNLTKEWEYQYRRQHNQAVYQSSGETFSYHQLQKLASGSVPSLLHPHHSSYPPTQWLTYIDFSIWIPEVLMSKVDRMSMAHSLELRAPFLDHDIVEYMLGVEASLKQGDTNKAILKHVAEPYLPKSIIHRQKKGFSSPFIEWLYDGYGDAILNLMQEVNEELGLFNQNFITLLYQEGKEGRFKQHLYSLYLFCRWYKKVYML